MALGTYAELAAAVTSYLERDDQADNVPIMIRLAESQIERALRVREMHAIVDGTLLGSVEALPDAFLDVESISLTASERQPLKYLPPTEFFALQAANEGGLPIYCTYVGVELHIAPAPSDEVPYRLVYFSQLPPLGEQPGESESNWLLAKAPDLYLFAALAELESFVMNDERVVGWMGRRDLAIDELNGRDRLLRSRNAGQRSRRPNW